MVEAVMEYAAIVSLVSLTLAALAAARWFWKSAPSHRRRGLADRPSPSREEEPVPYVAVRPGQRKPPQAPKKWLKP